MSEATRFFASQGLLGIVVVVLGWWFIAKDREARNDREEAKTDRKAHADAMAAKHALCEEEKALIMERYVAEQAARIADASRMTQVLLDFQEKTHVNQDQFAKLAAEIGRMMSAVERNTQATERLTDSYVKGRA